MCVMAITLGSNIASLQAQRQLFSTERKLSTVFERLSSGQRINKASDDAAGLAISESLRTDRRVFNQAVRNLNDGVSVLNIADSTVAELSSVVIRIQELAEQAANGSLSNTQRASLNDEAQALRDEFFRVSRSADFNGLKLFDGSIEDGLRLQAGYGRDGSIFSSLGGVMGDGSFENISSFDAGAAPLYISAGDLNGDGNVDTVVSNAGSSSITINFGNGDGTFKEATTLSTGTNPFASTLVDTNGDGALDVVVVNRGSNTANVFIGNGDGTFEEAITFGTDTGPDSVIAEDLNQDGIVDLAIGHTTSDAIAIFMGNGDGSFRATELYDLGAGAATLEDLTVGDVNGDGIADIVSVDFGFNTANLLLGNGDGTFTDVGSFDVGESPRSVDLVDVDRDGFLDLVMGNGNGQDVTVFRGDGEGSFSSFATISVGEGLEDALVRDVNGDGFEDVVAVGDNKAFVALGYGDGTFASAQTLTLGDDIRSAVLEDFNNDGVLDLGVSSLATEQFLIATGNSREGIAPILEFSLETQADALQAIAPLERKLASLSEQRGTIGAFQSRLQSALATLGSTSENYANAESRIKDADIAFESSQLTRLNILQQAASAVLGQANQQPALALQLLS